MNPVQRPKSGRKRALLILAGAALLPFLFALLPVSLPGVHDGRTGEAVAGFELSLPREGLVFEPLLGPARAFVLSPDVRSAVWVWLFWALGAGAVWAGIRWRRRELGECPARTAGHVLWRGGLPFLFALFFLTAFCSYPYVPGYRLRAEDRDVVLADFQTHTYRSDGYYSPAFNLAWHREHGYHAVAITDPHTLAGAREAVAGGGDMVVLVGEERRFPGAGYFLVFGLPSVLDTRGLPSLEGLAEKVHRVDGASIVSCALIRGPGRKPLVRLFQAGFDGVEAYNHGWQPKKGHVGELDRALAGADRPLLGSHDWHGKGHGAKVWTAVRVPGWRGQPPGRVAERIRGKIRSRRSEDFRVLVAGPTRPPSLLRRAFDPLVSLGSYLVGLTLAQAAAWALWIGVVGFLALRLTAGRGSWAWLRAVGAFYLAGAASFLAVHGTRLLHTGLSVEGAYELLPALGAANLVLALGAAAVAAALWPRPTSA